MFESSSHEFSRREFIGGLAAGVALGAGELLRPRLVSASSAAPPLSASVAVMGTKLGRALKL